MVVLWMVDVGAQESLIPREMLQDEVATTTLLAVMQSAEIWEWWNPQNKVFPSCVLRNKNHSTTALILETFALLTHCVEIVVLSSTDSWQIYNSAIVHALILEQGSSTKAGLNFLVNKHKKTLLTPLSLLITLTFNSCSHYKARRHTFSHCYLCYNCNTMSVVTSY